MFYPVSPDNGRHHFFGYYDVSPWNRKGDKFLCLETSFMDRPPGPEDEATLLLIEIPGKKVHVIDKTKAWNWQMGCRLQWLPSAPNSKILYNARQKDRFVTVILDVETGNKKIITMPTYAVSRDGKKAVSLNFSRLNDTRPGYGYAGIPDANASNNMPDDDGLFLLDFESGRSKMILSYEQIVSFEHTDEMDGCKHRINHLFWRPDNQRILFLHRWRVDERQVRTRMLTVNPEGTELNCAGYSHYISHYDWQHIDKILVWAQLGGFPPDYLMVSEFGGRVEPLKQGRFSGDGHCSWSPDKKWVLADTYPDEKLKYGVFLYHPSSDTMKTVAELTSPKEIGGETRCDLHPRWHPNGKAVSFDGVTSGKRRVFVADVSEIIGGVAS
ncbi:MAG: hypothetical protein JW957_03430 [Candidatus Omnitrophica bacterium]|nr:hypothetical protein [Candidatus Omnitrophota bacterium]